MRQLEMLISTIAGLAFGKDGRGDPWTEELDQEHAALAEKLTGLLRNGQMGKAEDMLFLELDTDDKRMLAVALDFYRQANSLSDDELEAQDFTREELLDGLRDVCERYGLQLPELGL